jgi:regulator of nucleoside diphosphate kinase
MNATKEILITDTDRDALREMARSLRTVGDPYRSFLRDLEVELAQATVVPADEVGPDVVTMGSRVRVRDLDTENVETFTLVYPEEADVFGSKLSVLNGFGIAVLGARAGDEIALEIPRGRRRLRIEQVLYQPESAGRFHPIPAAAPDLSRSGPREEVTR